jgi:hypothetical protein
MHQLYGTVKEEKENGTIFYIYENRYEKSVLKTGDDLLSGDTPGVPGAHQRPCGDPH